MHWTALPTSTTGTSLALPRPGWIVQSRMAKFVFPARVLLAVTGPTARGGGGGGGGVGGGGHMPLLQDITPSYLSFGSA